MPGTLAVLVAARVVLPLIPTLRHKALTVIGVVDGPSVLLHTGGPGDLLGRAEQGDYLADRAADHLRAEAVVITGLTGRKQPCCQQQ